jgi:hypothetical protein
MLLRYDKSVNGELQVFSQNSRPVVVKFLGQKASNHFGLKKII